MSDRERVVREKLRTDFEHYAAKCLKIRTKDAKTEPLLLNSAQKHLHRIAENQRAATGKVRIITVKGRQQGVSTYIQGRFYWRATHRRGVRAFILTHEQDASNRMYEMAERYHEHCPSLVRPVLGEHNAKELKFPLLDSGYEVGTAGNKAVGRSSTLQYFHGSEVAFWRNAGEHARGVLQAVADTDDTEVWLESTGNGSGNYFAEQYKAAKEGKSEFIAVFIPWFWQDEYRIADATIERTEAEETLAKTHGLDDEQLAWRRKKITELGGEDAFRREYPNTDEDAFKVAVVGSYYGDLLSAARADGRICKVPHDPRLKVHTSWDLGIGDSTAIWFWQLTGREHRLIDYYESSGVGLDHYAKVLNEKPYNYGGHIGPHDAANKELGSGKTRVETLATLGIRMKVLPRGNVEDRINAVRMTLPMCWIDEEKCERGLTALANYRRVYDDNLKDFRPVPLHDWASHGSDAFGYGCEGVKDEAKLDMSLYTAPQGDF